MKRVLHSATIPSVSIPERFIPKIDNNEFSSIPAELFFLGAQMSGIVQKFFTFYKPSECVVLEPVKIFVETTSSRGES